MGLLNKWSEIIRGTAWPQLGLVFPAVSLESRAGARLACKPVCMCMLGTWWSRTFKGAHWGNFLPLLRPSSLCGLPSLPAYLPPTSMDLCLGLLDHNEGQMFKRALLFLLPPPPSFPSLPLPHSVLSFLLPSHTASLCRSTPGRCMKLLWVVYSTYISCPKKKSP